MPATGRGTTRYLFALPQFKDNSPYEKDLLPPGDVTLTLSHVGIPVSVTLLRDGSSVPFTFEAGTLSVKLPATKRTNLPDVVRIELPHS